MAVFNISNRLRSTSTSAFLLALALTATSGGPRSVRADDAPTPAPGLSDETPITDQMSGLSLSVLKVLEQGWNLLGTLQGGGAEYKRNLGTNSESSAWGLGHKTSCSLSANAWTPSAQPDLRFLTNVAVGSVSVSDEDRGVSWYNRVAGCRYHSVLKLKFEVADPENGGSHAGTLECEFTGREPHSWTVGDVRNLLGTDLIQLSSSSLTLNSPAGHDQVARERLGVLASAVGLNPAARLPGNALGGGYESGRPAAGPYESASPTWDHPEISGKAAIAD